MGLNINSGALRHPIQWYYQPEGTDDNGNPYDKVKLPGPDIIMANVRVTSGSQSVALGAEITDEMITVLTWYDPTITNDLYILWDNKTYEISHIKPDELYKGMLITARMETS
ncbi:MAG: head-tail adaptor protein [Colwellia sp.]|nr:head-tail adaptor protein [Colwellia sp.]